MTEGEKKEQGEKKEWKEREISEKEKKIRAITRLYYSNPKILEAMTKFSQDREVVPRYFEGFGKRPDKIQYPSDIMGLVNRGATSFHASEELWNDSLSLNNEMTQEEMSKMRKSWDLLIDVDSPFLDYSKIATRLVIDFLERYGVKNYGLKFSGSKGFHIIVSGKAFPEEYDGMKMKENFPEWPRAICEFIIKRIRAEFNKQTSSEEDIQNLSTRTNLGREEIVETVCPECNRPMVRDKVVTYKCNLCGNEIMLKKSIIANRRVIRCNMDDSLTKLVKEEEIFRCPDCKISNQKIEFKEGDKISHDGRSSMKNYREDVVESIKEEKRGNLDLVLVAPRHLFRMPYSLHEKTALASVVIKKEELDSFAPQDANPLKIKIQDFMPNNAREEARELLAAALEWKKTVTTEEEKSYKKYSSYDKIDIAGVTEEMFPEPIKKLLKGLKEGKKRGLFILVTFLRSLNFPADYINQKTREWNKLNEPPLKEGYVKSQIDWHLRQKKTILPPNYENPSFYRDLGLLDKKPEAKNPVSEVIRKLRRF
jgi:predicted RNA-binding Zn-ribbon protein involved in translation (DUF1610 family)